MISATNLVETKYKNLICAGASGLVAYHIEHLLKLAPPSILETWDGDHVDEIDEWITSKIRVFEKFGFAMDTALKG